MATILKERFNEILRGSLTAEELKTEAAGLFLFALQNRDRNILGESEDITQQMTLADKSEEPKRKRLHYAMAIAVMITRSPMLAGEYRKREQDRSVPTIELNQPLFYRDFDPKSPLVTGQKYLGSAALRVGVAMARSLTQLDDAGAEWFAAKFSLETLKTLAIFFAGYVLMQIASAGLASVVSAVLIVWGFSGLWEEVKRLAGELGDFWRLAVNARNDEDLTLAGGHFARALAGGVLDLVEILISHRVFRAVETKIAKRTPTPERLRAEYERATKEIQTRRRAALEKAKRAVEVLKSGARGEGMRNAAEGFDWQIAAGVIAASVVLVGGAYALSSDSKAAP